MNNYKKGTKNGPQNNILARRFDAEFSAQESSKLLEIPLRRLTNAKSVCSMLFISITSGGSNAGGAPSPGPISFTFMRFSPKQECIPVECIPPAHWPSVGGVPAWGCTCPGGVPARGCVPARGLPAWGYLSGGVYLPRGDSTWAGTPPLWTEWQTGAKILPCPKLRLRAVKKTRLIYPLWGWRPSVWGVLDPPLPVIGVAMKA